MFKPLKRKLKFARRDFQSSTIFMLTYVHDESMVMRISDVKRDGMFTVIRMDHKGSISFNGSDQLYDYDGNSVCIIETSVSRGGVNLRHSPETGYRNILSSSKTSRSRILLNADWDHNEEDSDDLEGNPRKDTNICGIMSRRTTRKLTATTCLGFGGKGMLDYERTTKYIRN